MIKMSHLRQQAKLSLYKPFTNSVFKIYVLLLAIIGPVSPLICGQSLKEFEEDFIKIIEKVRNSVVSVEIISKQQKHKGSSGIILDRKGHIVTVASALQDSHKIYVRTASKPKYVAKLIGIDLRSNLAVLKIDAPALTPIQKKRKTNLRVGAFLLVLGNPYGLGGSVSFGIVSGLNRTMWFEASNNCLTGLIQTTAPINPGDPGGLVVDCYGNFVGIASARLARNPMRSGSFLQLLNLLKKELHDSNVSQLQLKKVLEVIFRTLPPDALTAGSSKACISQNINFVLPSTTIHWVAQQIIKHGKVRRGWMGIQVKNHEQLGVIISHVYPESPAAKQGLMVGDHLLKIGQQNIANADFLLHRISHSLVGTKIVFTLKRGDQQQNVTVQLATFPK